MNDRNFVRALLCLWSVLAIVFLFTRTHKFVVVSGTSMQPTLHSDDVTCASSIVNITVGNIYLCREPLEGRFVIKRLIGIPGDIIEFKDGVIYRNGHIFMAASANSWDNATYTLGPDDYLFVGDNRVDSFDGRYWPRFVHLDEICYELQFVIYPSMHWKDLRW